ncbi:SAM-dependent methyltransferase [Sphingobium xanthum]|uniref:methyltransferase domain-containing protein n=1 Tax=Sphingobium xanthum TaxID=1387165 RepID=UPI001C8CEA00|nr:methyltransferase domain-containing protein [Sphingobium xanthum]
MDDAKISRVIKAEFSRHNDALIEREVRRLRRFGPLSFNAAPYQVDPQDFCDRMQGYCSIEARQVDGDAFEKWYVENDYRLLFEDYTKTYPDENLLKKKAFEHWLSLRETEGASGGVVLDVGCATSPFFRLWKREESPATPFLRVDLPLPEYGFLPGRNGDVIGCSADAIPLDDQSVARIYSHNAIEHFEGGAYAGFFKECARVLQPGGVLYVCPLFVACSTFAYVSLTGIYRRLSFPKIIGGTNLVYSDAVGQPYELYIDTDFLTNRIIGPLEKMLDFHLIMYTGHAAVEHDVRLGLLAIQK